MTSHVSAMRSRRCLVTAIAISAGLLGGAHVGVGVADAAKVAGLNDQPGVSRDYGAETLSITLSTGNSDVLEPPTGKIAGVTIKLERLKGINPENAADRAKVRNTSADEIAGWPTDRRLTAVTNDAGQVRFQGLEKGIYLVSSQAPAGAAAGEYREISPFLVAVPFHTVDSNPRPVEGVIVAKTTVPPSTPPTDPPSTPPSTPPENPPTTPTPPPGETPPADTPEQGSTPESVPGDENGRGPGNLPMTGVQILGIVLAAVALMGAGLLMLLISKKRKQEG
ncbi:MULTISPECIES: LPXTG cell wall anchor domain-containing protein [unclassified Corynebacterium]|uniref:LPXTG cell wall anchor domain-containing protein n=1 Tax=unclassified Corynebacterium TaxID=2624378 RepID=UPI001EF4A2DE|nr:MULTISPECIES: LPXTG cell wall anchor domain-containing protein [unclassified Corynebacterium]MCG7258276.1 LPXTG cell wall anchor domain-containing protein [Corynebacterium sp. ACRQK]MCG7262821.1 LPXTG cell wall anchor domain-containing protein [Corynebacterium sp. ACRQL]